MLAHLRRPGRAVQADQVDPQRLERGQRRPDLGAEQHRAGGLHRHVDHDRQVRPGPAQRPAGTDHRGLGLQQVLRCLDQHGVHAAGEETGDLRLVRIAQRGEADVPQRGQLRARPDRAQDPARPVRRAEPVRDLARDPRPCLGELGDPVRSVVLREVGQVGAEGVGLDGVDADREEVLVHGGDDVGPGDVEDLVAALQTREVIEVQVAGLQHRPHRAVGHDDPLAQGAPQVCRLCRADVHGHRV